MEPVRPRLLLITHEFHPHRGGIAVYAAEMATAAIQLGYAVEVWAPEAGGAERAASWPFELRRLPMPATQDLSSQWRMAREIFAHRHALRGATLYLPEPGPILAMLFLQYFGVPRGAHLVLTLHGSEILRLHRRAGTRLAAGRLFVRADRVSVVSRHTRDLLLGHFPSAAGRVALTPGALRGDFPREASAPSTKPADARIVILTVARLHPRKGQMRVIEALRALPAAQRARIEYWIAGAHGKEGYDHALREAAALADFPVKLLGDVPDAQLPGVYAQADIFAMTSVPHKQSVEGFGLVYLEAGAHGLPVVAHAIGGVPEAVLDGETGLLVPPEDPAALTAVFARLIDDAALRRRLGAAGRSHALRHSWLDSARTLFGQPAALPSS